MISKVTKHLNSQAPGPVKVLTATLAGAGPWLALSNTPQDHRADGLLYASIWAIFALLAIWAHLWSPAAQREPGIVAAWVICGVATVEGWFALAYWTLAGARPAAFSDPVDRVGAAYFSISTATTTGMGDIHPVTDGARLLVTGQMIASLFLVVLAISAAASRFFQAQSDRFKALEAGAKAESERSES